jgi:hypothetical protein
MRIYGCISKVVIGMLASVAVPVANARINLHSRWHPVTVFSNSDAVAVASIPKNLSGYSEIEAGGKSQPVQSLGHTTDLVIKEAIWGQLRAGEIIQFYQPVGDMESHAPLIRGDQVFFLHKMTATEIQAVNSRVEKGGDRLSSAAWTFATPDRQWMSWLSLPDNGQQKSHGRLLAQLRAVAKIEDTNNRAIVEYLRKLVKLAKAEKINTEDVNANAMDDFQREIISQRKPDSHD